MPRLLGLQLLAGGLLIVPAGATGGEEPPPAAQLTAEMRSRDTADAASHWLVEVDRWIAELDSDQFWSCKSASEQLVRAGKPAVDRLLPRFEGASLEFVTGGTQVLRELATASDAQTAAAARSALEQLASLQGTAAGRQAGAMLRILDSVRQQRALEHLRRLGARIVLRREQIGLQVHTADILSLEVGRGWVGDDQAIAQLAWLRDVPQISLSGPPVQDNWIAAIRDLPGLQVLTIKHAEQLSPKVLNDLAQLKGLRALELKYLPQVDDAAVSSLAALTQLAQLKLYGTRISPAGRDRLAKSLATTEIDYRGGAFMGVECSMPPEPCVVRSVQPESAALQAGLLPNDIILRYGGRAVGDFESLRQLIAENRSGDTVAIEILRDAQQEETVYPMPAGGPAQLACQPHPLGGRITDVAPGSLAAGLQLQPGDIVSYVNRVRLHDVSQLPVLLRQLGEGEPASVRFFRGGTPLIRQITFGEWD